MRKLLFVGLSIVGLVGAAMPTSGLARTRQVTAATTAPDRYCLQGRIWGYPGNCQFATYAQCAATASGTNAYCDVNPQYLFARQQQGYRPSR